MVSKEGSLLNFKNYLFMGQIFCYAFLKCHEKYYPRVYFLFYPMLRHIFCNQLKARSIFCCDKARMSRHKNMLFKCTYVTTKRNNVATNTFLQNQRLKPNF